MTAPLSTSAPANVLTTTNLDSPTVEGGPIVPSVDALARGFRYQMITSFEVANFRSFKSLRLKGLQPINILVGKSAAGKTSLLEAIKMALGGTPNVAWALNAFRGIPVAIAFNPTREQFESLFSPLFPNFDIGKTISFKVTDSTERTATVEIKFDPERPVTPVPQNVPKRDKAKLQCAIAALNEKDPNKGLNNLLRSKEPLIPLRSKVFTPLVNQVKKFIKQIEGAS